VEDASESKGQGGLSKRERARSLTSLPAYWTSIGSAYPANDEHSPVWSRHGGSRSRGGSRASSRWPSGRGSRVGLQIPGDKTPTEGYSEGIEVDFANGDEEDEDEEGYEESELRRLITGRVGGLFDDLFGGWLDYRGEEDGETQIDRREDEPDEAQSVDRRRRKLRRIEQRAHRLTMPHAAGMLTTPPPQDGDGIFGDALWLLGLAKKIMT